MTRSNLWSGPIFVVAVLAMVLIFPGPSAGFGLHYGSRGGYHYGHHGHHGHHGYHGSHYGGHSSYYGGHYLGYNYGHRYGHGSYFSHGPHYDHRAYYLGSRSNYFERRPSYAFTIRPQQLYYGESNGRGFVDQSRRSGSTLSAAYSYANESGGANRSHSSEPDSEETMPYPEHPVVKNGDHDPATSGWALLADKPSAALAVFALEATNNPTRGLPKAGYAIAQALLNNNTSAIWAMRRALEFEATALHYVPLDESLGERFDELIVSYRHRLEEGTGHPGDDHVMIATLAYIRHDYEVALSEATGAIDTGDRQPTTQALLELVEKQLTR